MPLPLPALDRRTWDELVSEARTLIPRYAGDWTDHNVHDSGITLVELFAWLGEMMMFRADRIPPAELRAFLRWVGIEPRPPQVAATVVALELPPGAAPQPLAAGLELEDAITGLVFEAPDAVLATSAWLELDPAEGSARGQLWSEAGGAATDLRPANCRPGRDLLALGAAPAPGDALWIGFDTQPAPAGQPLSLYVWTDSWATDADVRAALIAEQDECAPCPAAPPTWPTLEECLRACEEGGQAAAPAPPAPSDAWKSHYSARVAWEGWDGGGWRPLHVLADDTRALTLSGPVRVELPALAIDPPAAPAPGYRWIRCRLVSGSYECPPRLAGIAVNAVEVRNAATVTGPQQLGVSRGHACETYRVDGRVAAQGSAAAPQPLVPGSLRLRLVHGADVDDSWTEVENWDRSGPFDRHYVTDPATNSLRLGDGRVGAVSPADWALEALEYRVGGGAGGNLPPRRVTRIIAGAAGAAATVRQPFAAVGGAPAESLDRAHGRALDLLGRPSRGVTAADWETLALATPGVPVARAHALPGHHPEFPCWSAPGVVTLVVVPRCGTPPAPGPDFLAAVGAYLRRRRPLSTELHVVGPRFVKVSVSATLHVDVASARLAAAAQAALDAFLDPLAGGPDGGGWPFGRGVLATDLLDVLAGLDGVAHVDELRISTDGCESSCENLELCPTDLVESTTHHFDVVEDRNAGA